MKDFNKGADFLWDMRKKSVLVGWILRVEYTCVLIETSKPLARPTSL